MTSRRMARSIACVLLALAGTPLRAQEGPVVLFTADRGGEVLPCANRAGAQKRGGVARMGTLVRAERSRGDVLLLDGGNAFFGATDTGRESGVVVRSAYDALGFDVVNISYRDLRFGVDEIQDLLDGASFTPVSANLLSGQGQRLFEPFALVEVGQRRVAVVGVTMEPPGLQYLPQLREQFAGITFGDPLAKLEEVLPSARAEADYVVLLCYGDRDLVEAVHERFGDEFDAVAVGGIGLAGRLPEGSPPVAAATSEGRHLTRLVLGSDRTPEVIEISSDVAPDPELAESLASVIALVSPEDEDPTWALTAGLPVALDARSGATWSGAGLNLHVTSVARASVWQGLDAPAGLEWLIFDVKVENDIPTSLVYRSGRTAGERLRVVQRQKLFLVHGQGAPAVAAAAVVERPADPDEVMPGDLVLNVTGDGRGGQVAFAVPPASIEGGALQLRWYHDEVPPAVVTVRGETASAAATDSAAANGYVEMARPIVAFPDAVNGTAPPAGARWVSVALAGRSLSARAAPAAERKPQRRPGIGQILDAAREDGGEDGQEEAGPALQAQPAYYLESASHIELVADGQWARRAEPGLGTLPSEPTFLPDRFTGGTAVFLAPRDTRSLELSCAFPQLKLENGDELKPETLRFVLEGEPVVPAPEQAAIVIQDEPLALAVIGVDRLQRLGAIEAPDGRTLIVLDCRIENRGDEEGFLAPSERFKFADDVSIVGAVGLAGLPLVEPFRLPVGERRAFGILCEADSTVGGPSDVSYAGVSVNPTFELDIPYEVYALEAPPPPSEELPPRTGTELGAIWREHAMPENEPSWSLEPGALVSVPAAVSAGGVTLAITATSLTAELEKYKAKEGEVFLVLDLEVRLAPNATPLAITDLQKYMVGVIDRHRLLGLHLLRRKGDLRTSFKLEPGDTTQGKIIFDLPREGIDSFSLEFVPVGREGLHLPILQSSHPPVVPFDSQQNQAFQADVLGFAVHDEIDGTLPVKEKLFVAVDLRVRSHLAGETLPPGLLPWHAMPDRVQLVVDGFHPIGLRKSAPTEMLREPTLFPTETLGGRLVFDVAPRLLAEAESVELVCGFEPVEIPGGGLLYPKTLRFQLDGERPDLTIAESAHRFEDVECTVAVDAFEQPDAFVGHGPKRGHSWLTTIIWLTAPEDRGVTIDPLRRFTLTDVMGTSHSIYGYTWNLPSPSKSGRPFWIPAGGQRRFTVAFHVPTESVEGAALVHRGLSRVAVLPIDSSSAAQVPAVDPGRATNGQLVFDEALEPRGLAGVGLKPEQVNQAIDRGREFLWGHLQGLMKKGELSEKREDLPAILALLHCKAHELYPEFDQALRRLLDRLEPQKLGVYELGLVSMIVDALDDPALEPLFETILVCLVESQGPEGAWGYGTRLPERLVRQFDPEPAPTASDAAFLLEVIGGDPPQAPGAEVEEITRTQSWYENRDGDNSVSQFAVLGLATAERHRLAIDSETWRGILGVFAGRQYLALGNDGFGGWGYTRSAPYGSMSCAGICSTAIAIRRFDPTADPRRDLRIRDGLAWLDRNWTVTENPGSKQWHYYFLYGLERVGRILDIEFIGEHEWYPEGAKFLVGAQAADGSWPGKKKEADPRIATSFALMFLTRATESLELDEDVSEVIAEGPGTLQTQIDLPAGTDNVYVILDASGSMLAKIDGRRKFDIARDAVRRLIEGLPQETQFALRVYGHRKRAIEDGAAEDTELLVPFAALDREGLSATLEKLRPRGKTPLTLSLQEALRDLGQAPRGKDTLVILLTDGGEDTRQDPVAAAESWAGRSSVQLLVMGFDIDRPNWERQLQAIADAAGGQYVSVDQADELAARVVSVVTPEPPAFEVLDDANETVARGRFGDEIPLEPGAYTLSFRFDGRPVTSSFWVSPGRVVRIHLDAASPGQ